MATNTLVYTSLSICQRVKACSTAFSRFLHSYGPGYHGFALRTCLLCLYMYLPNYFGYLYSQVTLVSIYRYCFEVSKQRHSFWLLSLSLHSRPLGTCCFLLSLICKIFLLYIQSKISSYFTTISALLADSVLNYWLIFFIYWFCLSSTLKPLCKFVFTSFPCPNTYPRGARARPLVSPVVRVLFKAGRRTRRGGRPVFGWANLVPNTYPRGARARPLVSPVMWVLFKAGRRTRRGGRPVFGRANLSAEPNSRRSLPVKPWPRPDPGILLTLLAIALTQRQPWPTGRIHGLPTGVKAKQIVSTRTAAAASAGWPGRYHLPANFNHINPNSRRSPPAKPWPWPEPVILSALMAFALTQRQPGPTGLIHVLPTGVIA